MWDTRAYGPAIDYILANRAEQPRLEIDAELLAAGWEPSVIEELWARIQDENRPKRPRERTLWVWNIVVWGLGIALAVYAGWSNCQGAIDVPGQRTCWESSGQTVMVYALMPVLMVWLVGFVVIRAMFSTRRR
jgi:hypothetical protein